MYHVIKMKVGRPVTVIAETETLEEAVAVCRQAGVTAPIAEEIRDLTWVFPDGPDDVCHRIEKV